MDKPSITGNGPLHGEVAIAGAKNAALTADGETSIDRGHHLDRGHASIEHKFARLGAIIHRV